MSEFDKEHDPDLSQGLAVMESLVKVFTPSRCANCGREIHRLSLPMGQPVANVFTGEDEDFCDAVCRRDYEEHYG